MPDPNPNEKPATPAAGPAAAADRPAFAFRGDVSVSDDALKAMVRTSPSDWRDHTTLASIRVRSRLLEFAAASEARAPTADQKEALCIAQALLTGDAPEAPRVAVIGGRAGTGKTFVLTQIARWCEDQGQHVLLLTQTNSAKVNAQKRSEGFFDANNSKTLHSLLYRWNPARGFNYGQPKSLPSDRSVIIVDEASLVSSQVLKDLLVVVRNRPNVKLIILGDKLQLGEIEQGNRASRFDLDPLKTPHVELVEVVRQQGGPVLELATSIAGKIAEAMDRRLEGASIPNLKFSDVIDWQMPTLPTQGEAPTPKGLFKFTRQDIRATELFCKLWAEDPGETAVIVATNEDRKNTNLHIRKQLFGHSRAQLRAGEPLIVLSNATPEYTNGTIFKAPANFEGVTPREIQLGNDKVLLYEVTDTEGQGGQPAETDLFGASIAPTKKFLLFPDTTRPSINDLVQRIEAYRDSANMPENRGQADLIRENAARLEGAIPITYAYAITAHKAQGMEWKNVIVIPNDVGASVRGQEDGEARWIYSAFTRAVESAFIWQPDDMRPNPSSPA